MWISPTDVAIFIGYNSFSTTTIPTAIQVESLIDLIESEIKLKLDDKNIDITGNTDLINVVKKYTCMGVAGLILNSYLNNNQNEGSQSSYFKSEYEKFLNNIENYLKIKNNKFEPSSNFLDGTITTEWWK